MNAFGEAYSAPALARVRQQRQQAEAFQNQFIPRTQNSSGGDWVYGDSFGGVEAAEQSALNADRNWLNSLFNQREAAFARQQNNRRYNDALASSRIASALSGRKLDLEERKLAAKLAEDQAYLEQDEEADEQIADRLAKSYESGVANLDEAKVSLSKLGEEKDRLAQQANRLMSKGYITQGKGKTPNFSGIAATDEMPFDYDALARQLAQAMIANEESIKSQMATVKQLGKELEAVGRDAKRLSYLPNTDSQSLYSLNTGKSYPLSVRSAQIAPAQTTVRRMVYDPKTGQLR